MTDSSSHDATVKRFIRANWREAHGLLSVAAMTANTSIAAPNGTSLGASPSRWLNARRMAAGAVLVGVPLFMTVRVTLSGDFGRFPALFFASYLTGAVAFTRRSPLAQVVARGIAWKFLIAQGWVLALVAMTG